MLAAIVQGPQAGGGHDGRPVGSSPQAGAVHEPELYGLLCFRRGRQLSEATGPAVRQGGVQLKYAPSVGCTLSLGGFSVYLSHVSVRFG